VDIQPHQPHKGQWRWRAIAVLVTFAVVAALVVTAYRLGENGATGFIEVPVGGSGNSSGSAPAELDSLIELYDELATEAVEAPDPEALIGGAKQGMLDAMEDPYARYYDPEAYAAFNEELEGVYSGVGMELEETGEGLFVVTVFPDSPAEQAGVRAGDRIVGVDGSDVREEPIEAVVTQVRGEEGTEVTLEVERNGDTESYDIVRSTITIPRLEAELLDDGIGYVRMFQFTGGVGDELRVEVADLLDQGADGVVLDLRGNPGGLLREAVGVASVFLDDEVVVRVIERAGEEEALETIGEAFADVPLVVLVNEGTASASEIVAGAVQDAGRGLIVGEVTFGKGTVQTIKSLGDGSGAKFTTAEYRTPSGESIEDVGVQPDRVVSGDEEQLAEAREVLRSEMAGASR
jgi:carboxyl-terminal processing protease